MRESSRFTDLEDEKLIQAIRNYPSLYDKKEKEFKNAQVKKWNAVAKAVGKDVIRCKRRWKDIRDNFFKIKRKQKLPPGPRTAKHCKWALYSTLLFLENPVKHEKKSDGNVSDYEESKSEVSAESIEAYTDDLVSNQSITEPKVTTQTDPLAIAETSNYRMDRPEIPSYNNHSGEDDLDIFMISIAMTIKKLPPHLIAQAKMSILSIVTQLQFSTSAVQPNHVAAPSNVFPNVPSI